MVEILIFEGLSASIGAEPDSEIATLSVMGRQPIIVHLPIDALPLLQRQIAELLGRSPQRPLQE